MTYLNSIDGGAYAAYLERRRLQAAREERACRGAQLDPLARALFWADSEPAKAPTHPTNPDVSEED